jgi:transcriptional regulator with XRE-family HTH domain
MDIKTVEELKNNVSKNLRDLRSARKLTRPIVADTIGIGVQTLRDYEFGEKLITGYPLAALAVFYGTTTDHILGLAGLIR